MTIKMRCPRCGQKIGVPEGVAGTVGNCPRCGDPMTIPASAPMRRISRPLPRPLVRPISGSPLPWVLLGLVVVGGVIYVASNSRATTRPQTTTAVSSTKGQADPDGAVQPVSKPPESIPLPAAIAEPPSLEGPPWEWMPGEGTALEAYMRWLQAWDFARNYRFYSPDGLVVFHTALDISDPCSERPGPLPEPPADWKDRIRKSAWSAGHLPEDYLAARDTYLGAVCAANQAHERWLAELDATGQKAQKK